MIGKGKAVNQIAEELHVSANTVRTYRTRILEKIGVKGTSELIHYAVMHGLAEQ
jgi:DNA-binding NarL/FixJ family response regulator